MKDIRIDYLELTNFKCHAHLRVVLGGRDAYVFGDNGVGKTSIYDGLTWLLFGKDSRGNSEKVIDLKPLDPDGAVKDHLAVTAVEAALLVDGERTVLRRTLRELWGKRRGQREAVFEGNTSEYFIDGVPMKKSAFDSRVRSLVPEELFRMLNSVSYFAADLNWQSRRSLLFDMAGSLTDRELLALCPRFDALRQALGELELRELKARLLQEKKGLAGLRQDVPARIQECRRILGELEEEDFSAAHREERRLETVAAELEKALAAPEDPRLSGLRRKAEELEARERRSRELQRQLEAARALAESCKEEFYRISHQLEKTRAALEAPEEVCHPETACPLCGQTLPQAQQRAAEERFRLHREQERKQRRQELERLCRKKDEAYQRLEEAEHRENALADEQRELHRGHGALEETLQTIAALGDDRQALQRRREEALQQLKQVRRTLAREGLGDSTRQRIARLEEEAENARRTLESIDTLLYAMEEFTRFKAERLEQSVNALFRLADFRLFREQVSGGLEERCDVLCGGVPYLGLNNAGRVNVGIDIINSLSRHYGIRFPLFIDNAEAVIRLEPCESQLIRLVVREGVLEVQSAEC